MDVHRRPLRTCIGCRRRAPAAEMIRLRLDHGVLVTGPGPGRGASLHRTPKCVEAAARPGVLGRAFKRAVGLPSELLTQLVSVIGVTPSPDGHP
jgi:predicted RNA-binding protein YlxR (DUF448 family)